MLTAIAAIVVGLALLVWSADRFVVGASSLARHFGVPPLLVGMVIVGFGTSAPELFVSANASLQGNPGIALGNAYGSNIANIALILGLVAVLSPIPFHSNILRKELPILTAVTGLAAWQLADHRLTRAEGILLLAVFGGLMYWTVRQGRRNRSDALEGAFAQALAEKPIPTRRAWIDLAVGLAVLVGSSRMLVWGAVEVAQRFGVSDLVIGLTIVAVGTSLPELASSIAAVRKQEHDIALGNVLGSNLFNTLAVVGIATSIHPLPGLDPSVFQRDALAMGLATVALFVIGYGFRGRHGRINRVEGALLLLAYAGYMAVLVRDSLPAAGF